MKNIRYVLLVVGLCCMLLAPPGNAWATTILFTATDLPDALGPGGDLWQYSYMVSGFTFPANFSFSVFFAPNLYSDLEDPPPAVNADWDIITVQPDTILSDDGFYDALALVKWRLCHGTSATSGAGHTGGGCAQCLSEKSPMPQPGSGTADRHERVGRIPCSLQDVAPLPSASCP